MPQIQNELVRERVSAVAVGLACHAADNAADRVTWAVRLLLSATHDLEPAERSAVRQGVGGLMRMFGLN